jgi:hypothetical protein
MIYKRLIFVIACLGLMCFPCKGESADKKEIEEWYVLGHAEYTPLKTIFGKHKRYKELKGVSTPQELVDKLKENGDDVELIDMLADNEDNMFRDMTAQDKEKLKTHKAKFYQLISKSKKLFLIITNKKINEVKEILKAA